jgi:hypothetical protein
MTTDCFAFLPTFVLRANKSPTWAITRIGEVKCASAANLLRASWYADARLLFFLGDLEDVKTFTVLLTDAY